MFTEIIVKSAARRMFAEELPPLMARTVKLGIAQLYIASQRTEKRR